MGSSERIVALAAVLVLSSCAPRKPPIRLVEREIGGRSVDAPLPRKSSLPPPDDDEPPPEPEKEPAPPRSRAWVASETGSRFRVGHRDAYEAESWRAEKEPIRVKSSTATAGPSGERADEAQPPGNPSAPKPDELSPVPSDRPARYFSPAPLKGLRQLPDGDGDGLAPIDPAEGDAPVEASAKIASFPPQATAALDDEVPDTGVADPTAMGSYHIQISSRPGFHAPLAYDKVYPFMADIDLASDMLIAKVPPGPYWVRYSVVDLLGFEHPFTRPRRVLLSPP